MAKNEQQDIQILQSMVEVQRELEDLIEEAGGTEAEVVADDKTYKLVYFNMLNLLYLTKNLSTKSKKAIAPIMDDFKSAAVFENLTYCYPIISKEEIVKYAAQLSNDESQYVVKDRHAFCIEKLEGK